MNRVMHIFGSSFENLTDLQLPSLEEDKSLFLPIALRFRFEYTPKIAPKYLSSLSRENMSEKEHAYKGKRVLTRNQMS